MIDHNDKAEMLCAAVASSLALERESVSSDDTFLSLGGDSLAAMYVVEALNEKGFNLDPIALFNEDDLGAVAWLLVVR